MGTNRIDVYQGARSSQVITWHDGEKLVHLRHYRVAEGVLDGISYAVITPSSPGGPGLWIISPEGERISIQVVFRLPAEGDKTGAAALTCAAARKWCQAFLGSLGWTIGEDFSDEDEDPPELPEAA